MSAVTRSGLLFGLFAFFSNLGLGVLLAICAPLCSIVWGIGAGIATVAWTDQTTVQSPPARDGAVAGAIAGAGALLGVIIGLVLQFALLGGQQAATELSSEFYDQFDIDVPATGLDSSMQWFGLSATACCLGLLNIVLMAGAGAAAAAVYSSARGKETRAHEV